MSDLRIVVVSREEYWEASDQDTVWREALEDAKVADKPAARSSLRDDLLNLSEACEERLGLSLTISAEGAMIRLEECASGPTSPRRLGCPRGVCIAHPLDGI